MNGIVKLACGLDIGEPHRRIFVGRPEMRPAPLRQPLRRGLQHDPLRDADAAQATELVAAYDARVDVWQQAGLIEHERAHRGEIVDRGAKPSSASAPRAAG